jgi:hypothetical protein
LFLKAASWQEGAAVQAGRWAEACRRFCQQPGTSV